MLQVLPHPYWCHDLAISVISWRWPGRGRTSISQAPIRRFWRWAGGPSPLLTQRSGRVMVHTALLQLPVDQINQ